MRLLFNSPLFASIPFQLFLKLPLTALFLFLHMYLRLWPSSSLFSRLYAVSRLPHESPPKSSFFFFTARFLLCFTRMFSIFQRYQRYKVKTPLPCGQSRHHRLPFVLPYPSFYPRGVPSSSTSHPDYFFFFWQKSILTSLPTALFGALLRPLFPIQQDNCVAAFLQKPAPLCKLFAGLGSTNKFVTTLRFSTQITALSLPYFPLLRPSFYLTLSGLSGRKYSFFLPFLLLG